jgi:hypothetical protein
MASSVYKAPDVKTLQEIIEGEGIDAIHGRPNCHTLISLVNQLCAGARQIHCDYSNFGMMWIILPQPIYFQLTNEAVVAPLQPNQVPPFNINGTQTENNIIAIQWQKQKEQWETVVNTNKALIAATKNVLDAKVKQTLNSLFIGTAHQTFLDYFNELWTKWGRPTPNDIRDNGNRMRAPWDPVHQDMAELINQIRNASIFGHFTNHNVSDLDMVTAGEQLIIDTGLFASQYAEWRRRPENTRAWTDFEVFWTTEYDLWIETSRTANSVGMGYAGQAEATQTAEAEQAYFQSLQQFGATNQHNAETFNHLSEATNHLANGVSASIQQMQQELRNLALAVNRQAAPPGYNNHQYQAPPPTNIPPPPVIPQQPMYQQPYQQGYNQPTNQQGYYQNQGRGGRFGARSGRGRGRGGRGRGGYQQTNQHHGGQVPPQQFQAQGGEPTGFYGNRPPPNPVKYFKNWNYCWSHGFDVPDDHDSQRCPDPKPGHVYYATRTNPCNGCMKAKHKTQL